MPEARPTPEVLAALRRIPFFAPLGEAQIAAIPEGEEIRLPAGARIATEGDPADGLYAVLSGETEWTKRVDGEEVHAVSLGAGTIFAELILLLGAPYPTTGRAVTDVHLYRWVPDAFSRLMAVCPAILRGVLAVATERSQIHESVSQQAAGLASLGRMAAGLAHELNNPAAAVRRAAADAREAYAGLSARAFALERWGLSPEERAVGAALPGEVAGHAGTIADLDPLARGDREDELAAWLEGHGIDGPWELAEALAGGGLDPARLDAIAAQVRADALGDVLAWVAAATAGDGLLREVERGAARISELVGAVKRYSAMDQAASQEVDVNAALDDTLTVLAHELGQTDITVTREYDRTLPGIFARGGELNQFWTGLLDNAIDAIRESGGTGRIAVRTWAEPERLVVEIGDDGAGIPDEVRPRIFDPLFTTKPVGEGTGLGLDLARRIVVGQHGGDIRVASHPGDTRFQVRSPLTGSGVGGRGDRPPG